MNNLTDIITSLPRVSKQLAPTYMFYAAVFFIINYYFYQRGDQWMVILFNLAILTAYMYNRETVYRGDQKAVFEGLEATMRDLIPESWAVANYLWVDPWMIDFFQSVRIYQSLDPKDFNQCLLRVNEFLRLAETGRTDRDMERMRTLQKEALNYFHSIVYSQVSEAEVDRHNMLRYKLEEEMNRVFLDRLNEMGTGVRLNDFGFDKARSNFDLY